VIVCSGTKAHHLPQLFKRLASLRRRAEVMMLSAELMRNQIASLERAKEAASKHTQCKKKRIQKRETLTKGERENILAQ
jgi:hypothetical protein